MLDKQIRPGNLDGLLPCSKSQFRDTKVINTKFDHDFEQQLWRPPFQSQNTPDPKFHGIS